MRVVAYERELVALIIPADSSSPATLPGNAQARHICRPRIARTMPNRDGIWRCQIRNSSALNLLTANSRPRRSEVSQIVAARSQSLHVQAA